MASSRSALESAAGGRGELGEGVGQLRFFAGDERLRLGPRKMRKQGFRLADLDRDFLVAPRLAGLALQAFDLRVELAEDVGQPRKVALGGLEAQLGFVAAAMQPGDAGGVLQNAAALLGLGVDDLGDLSLAHERRRAGARGRVLEQDLDVARAGLAAVDAIGGAGLALDAARDLDHFVVVEFGRRQALGVVEEDRDFGRVSPGPRVGAGEDDVVHGGGAHGLVRGSRP